MKRERFPVEQITAILQQVASGVPIGEVCRQAGVSQQTFTAGRRSAAACRRARPRELKQFREEDTKLKRLVADLSLDKVMLQDVVHKPF